MLNIKETQSKNECYISGILNELEIVEGKTHDNEEFVRGIAKIRVDQEIDGKVYENIIPVSMFSMRLKNDKTPNPVYDRIVGYKEKFTSVAAAEDISQASRVTISGSVCSIRENLWYDTRTNSIKSDFQLSSNFINSSRDNDEEKASFEMSGVVLKTRPEIDKNEEETGRLIVSLGSIGWGGKINVIELIAKDGAKAHIESNWQEGDTVNLIGVVNVTSKVVTWEEPQGFGEPIKRTRTETRRELIITGGSANGLEESASYDNDDVKAALAERKSRMDKIKEKALSSSTKSSPTKHSDFGF